MPGRNASPRRRRATRLSRNSCLTDLRCQPLALSSRTVRALVISDLAVTMAPGRRAVNLCRARVSLTSARQRERELAGPAPPDRPGARGQVDGAVRLDRQLRAEVIPEGIAARVAERHRVAGRRALPAEERRPVVVEVAEARGD